MPLYLLQPRQEGRGGDDLPTLERLRKKASVHHSWNTHFFHRMYVLIVELRADRQHFSLLLSEWWKDCSHRENKNGKWDRCELVSKPPHQPAQTLLGYRHTSGKNCQWDWYSARINKKWIELLRCKHKVTWAIMHLLRFTLIPPFHVSTVALFTFYLMCFRHLQINKICKSMDWTFGMLARQTNSTELMCRYLPFLSKCSFVLILERTIIYGSSAILFL